MTVLRLLSFLWAMTWASAAGLAQESSPFFHQSLLPRTEEGPWLVIGPVLMLLALATITAGLVWLLRGSPGNARCEPEAKATVDLLSERLARGEVDGEAFEERYGSLQK